MSDYVTVSVQRDGEQLTVTLPLERGQNLWQRVIEAAVRIVPPAEREEQP